VTLSSGSFHDCTSPEEKIAKKRPQQTYIPAANQNTFLHKTGSFYKDFVKNLLENDRFVPYRCRKTAHSTVPKIEQIVEEPFDIPCRVPAWFGARSIRFTTLPELQNPPAPTATTRSTKVRSFCELSTKPRPRRAAAGRRVPARLKSFLVVPIVRVLHEISLSAIGGATHGY
jgi:hypothetical protein